MNASKYKADKFTLRIICHWTPEIHCKIEPAFYCLIFICARYRFAFVCAANLRRSAKLLTFFAGSQIGFLLLYLFWNRTIRKRLICLHGRRRSVQKMERSRNGTRKWRPRSIWRQTLIMAGLHGRQKKLWQVFGHALICRSIPCFISSISRRLPFFGSEGYGGFAKVFRSRKTFHPRTE